MNSYKANVAYFSFEFIFLLMCGLTAPLPPHLSPACTSLSDSDSDSASPPRATHLEGLQRASHTIQCACVSYRPICITRGCYTREVRERRGGGDGGGKGEIAVEREIEGEEGKGEMEEEERRGSEEQTEEGGHENY